MSRSNPWNVRGGNLFDVLRREMDDLVGRIQTGEGGCDEMSSFAPRANVAESDKFYMITLDLPGMKPDDVAIELHEGRLTISGERQAEKAEPGETFHRLERPCGKFRRTFSLGPDVDSENVEAQYSDGVLRVTVAKSAKAQPRRINIKS